MKTTSSTVAVEGEVDGGDEGELLIEIGDAGEGVFRFRLRAHLSGLIEGAGGDGDSDAVGGCEDGLRIGIRDEGAAIRGDERRQRDDRRDVACGVDGVEVDGVVEGDAIAWLANGERKASVGGGLGSRGGDEFCTAPDRECLPGFRFAVLVGGPGRKRIGLPAIVDTPFSSGIVMKIFVGSTSLLVSCVIVVKVKVTVWPKGAPLGARSEGAIVAA